MTHVAVPRLHLHARSEATSLTGDLLDHLGVDGFAWLDGETGFVTSGNAATLEPADVATFLRSVSHDAAPHVPSGAGPRAVGALPFSGDGTLSVPARIVGRDRDGSAWMTTINGGSTLPRLRPATRLPKHFAIDATTDAADFEAMLRDALRLIDIGALSKVVLAREVLVNADTDFDVARILAHLRRTQPGCIAYADGGFVGASPELLVRRYGRSVESRPMAGTAPSDDTATAGARLASSPKETAEHRFVVDAVVEVLDGACDAIATDGPVPMQFADVSHLATRVTGTLRDPSLTALDLAQALHPTPAVAGTPRDAAAATIQRLEVSGRGRYAGPCGWVDAHGDGEFVVALRCADIEGSQARLHTGAGIVAGSKPDDEWAETQLKLEPMLRALIRP